MSLRKISHKNFKMLDETSGMNPRTKSPDHIPDGRNEVFGTQKYECGTVNLY